MDLRNSFRLPEGSGIAAFAAAQVHLFRHNAALQDYFLALQLSSARLSKVNTPPRSLARRALSMAEGTGYKVIREFDRRKYKVDVLYCPAPYYARRTENNVSLRTLMALAETDATVLCLLPHNAPFRAEIEAKIQAAGRSRQVTLLDPWAVLNSLARKWLTRVSRIRGYAAFNEIVEVLRPHGLAPPLDSRPAYAYTASFVEAWNCIAPRIEFDAVVTRCHWFDLCSPVCRTARQRGKPVITFQQGVIGHSLDVPVTVSKYVAFGQSSAALLARMNRSFFQAVGKDTPAVEFVSGGSLFDTVLTLPDQFSKQTLLIIDEPVGPDDYYGIGLQREAILHLAEKLMNSATPPRVIIRPHPHWDSLGLDAWKEIVRRHPNHCEISHATWTLEDDLIRSSAVVGIFSGALTIAAASGLPTFFIETEQGYATEDLACFRNGQILPPDDAFREMRRVLSDAGAYAEAREVALRNARQYYADGANLDLSAAFFERLLRI
jgi:hypothetical protein